MTLGLPPYGQYKANYQPRYDRNADRINNFLAKTGNLEVDLNSLETGDIVVAMITNHLSNNTLVVKPAGWTELYLENDSGMSTYVFWKEWTDGDPLTYALDWSNVTSNQRTMCATAALRGCGRRTIGLDNFSFDSETGTTEPNCPDTPHGSHHRRLVNLGMMIGEGLDADSPAPSGMTRALTQTGGVLRGHIAYVPNTPDSNGGGNAQALHGTSYNQANWNFNENTIATHALSITMW